MENLISISQALIQLHKHANFEATIEAKTKADNSFLGPQQNTKEYVPKKSNSSASQGYYSVENPISSLVPGGINAY